jgi:serine/threonine-protein kinase 24/25/MST4
MEYCSGGSCSDMVSLNHPSLPLPVRDRELKLLHSFSLQLKSGVFREDYVAIIAKELLKGLEYLHSEGKLHRDIKGQSERLAFVDRAQADWSLHSQLPTSYSVPLVMVSMHLCFTSPSCWT